MDVRKLNDAGLKLIKKFEGCSLVVYLDIVGYKTVGYGHMSDKLVVGHKITQAAADKMLDDDLIAAESVVASQVRVPLNDNQFSALVSFVFNLGGSSLKSSTLLKKLNAKDYIGASNEFDKWNHAGGKVWDGLTERREAEKDLFLL